MFNHVTREETCVFVIVIVIHVVIECLIEQYYYIHALYTWYTCTSINQ